MIELGALTEIKTGRLDANASVDDGQYPFFTCSKEALRIDKYSFDGDYVLVAGNGDLNVKHYIGKFDAYQRTYAIKSNADKLDSRYLYYFLSKYVDVLRNQSIGGVIKYIKIGNLTDAKIPLPPLAKQKQIAAILDAANSLRQKDQQLVEHYTSLGQSLFLEMFGDPVSNPRGWKETPLNQLCKKITDGTHHSPKLIPSGIPYVTARHVKNHGLDFNVNPTYVSKTDHDDIYKRCNPEYGDVLYIKDGATTGLACINTFKDPISLLSSLALLKLNTDLINKHYLCFWLNHRGVKENLLREFMSGAAIQRYTLKKINMFTLPLPHIELQNQFAERIAIIEKQKQQAQANLKKSEALFNSLLQRAFTGELTADEAA